MAVALGISLAIGIGAGVGAWVFDQRVLGCGTGWRAFLAAYLAAMATWVIALVEGSMLLRVPGSYGPVQYWAGDASASAMMEPRMAATFAVYLGVLMGMFLGLVALLSLLSRSNKSRLRRLLVPGVAGLLLWIAWTMVHEYGFVPTA